MQRRGVVGVIWLAAFWCAGLGAQQGVDSSRASAEVGLSSVYTDNFYFGTGDEPRESAVGGILIPRGVYRATKGKLDLLAALEGEIATFNTPGSLDDYEDARANLNSSWLATRRGRLDLRANFHRGHDPFGVNRTEDATVRDRELDIWHSTQGGGLFHYGAPEATLNAEVGLSAAQKRYQTNEAETRFLDFTSSSLQYTLFYNFSPKTATLFDFVRTNVTFDNSFGATDERSGDEYRVRTGLRWLATGKTSGDVRVGVFRRQFDGTASTEEGFDWEAGVQWAPRARTLLNFDTGRGSQESYRADTRVIITQAAKLKWKQHWGTRTNSELSVGRTATRFIGIGRRDTIYNLRLGADYALTESLSAVLAAEAFNRTSNEPTHEFDRFTAYLGVRLDY